MRYTYVALLVSGCAGAAADPSDTVDTDPVDTVDTDDTDTPGDSDGCRADVLEDDFVLDSRIPNGDPTIWPALPPTAIVATTYLQLIDTPEAQQAFGEAGGPVFAEISAPAAGLMGLSVGNSESCGVARTLTVWESEEAMMDFVTGPAHAAAMVRIGEMSRGGSATLDWTVAELGVVDWETIAAGLADYAGSGL